MATPPGVGSRWWVRRGMVGSMTGTKVVGQPEPSVTDLLARAAEERVDFVNMQFTDVMGIVKSAPFNMSTSAQEPSGAAVRTQARQ